MNQVWIAEALRTHARAKGDLVVNFRHKAPGAPFFVPGSEGAKIHATVLPQGDAPVMTKVLPDRVLMASSSRMRRLMKAWPTRFIRAVPWYFATMSLTA